MHSSTSNVFAQDTISPAIRLSDMTGALYVIGWRYVADS
jgi:hypothetical protein